MATNWKIPVGADVRKVLEASAQYDSNQNTAEGTPSGSEVDLGSVNRRDEMLRLAVADVRGAIQSAGRHPLSVTASAVPPEAEYHTLVLAAWRLVNSTPGLARSFLAGDGGAETPLAKLHNAAQAYLKDLQAGGTTTTPTDPTGRDYATAVQADSTLTGYNPALRTGIRYGDMYGRDSDYEAGFVQDTLTGALVQLPVDFRI